MSATVFATMVVLGLLHAPGIARAQGRLPEPGAAHASLPGDAWSQPSPRFELGYERPWPLAELHRASARARAGLGEALSLEAEFSHLEAGPARIARWGFGLRRDSVSGFLRTGLRQEEVAVEGAGGEREVRAQVAAGWNLGSLLVAARHERGVGDERAHPFVRSALALRLRGENWGLGALRRSSPWGTGARWEFGFSLGPGPGGSISFRSEENGGTFVVRATRGTREHRASVVVDGPRAGAFALAVGWR